MRKQVMRTTAIAAFIAVAAATWGPGATPVAADIGDDYDPPLSEAPGIGDPTVVEVPFSSPVSFSAAAAAAASYSGVVTGIRYDNPEMSGEYSYASGLTPTAFEAEFFSLYATTPAATALVVQTTVPDPDDLYSGRGQIIQVAGPGYVPPPAEFDAEMTARFDAPVASREMESRSTITGVDDWRAESAGVEITNYTTNRVHIVSSFWWFTGASAPSNLPGSFGIEFEVNMYGLALNGIRPFCQMLSTPIGNPKTLHAAQTQGWNWRVIRPDGVTAPSSLGAYADYNDLSDDCNRSSLAIGLRYPQAIQYVNGAYGVILVIDAPRGAASASTIDAVNQVVSADYCTSGIGVFMALTDCMGVSAGTWVSGFGPKAQTVLRTNRYLSAPKRCWSVDYSTDALGAYYDMTWAC